MISLLFKFLYIIEWVKHIIEPQNRKTPCRKELIAGRWRPAVARRCWAAVGGAGVGAASGWAVAEWGCVGFRRQIVNMRGCRVLGC